METVTLETLELEFDRIMEEWGVEGLPFLVEDEDGRRAVFISEEEWTRLNGGVSAN